MSVDPENGTLHTDFNSDVLVARSTISDRLEEARGLGLLEISQREGDHGNSKRHTLTQIGRVYRVALESMGVDEAHREYVEATREFDAGVEAMKDWVTNNDQYWTCMTLDNEFILDDELKSEDVYPGDDVPPEFDEFIVGDRTLREQLKDAERRRDRGEF